MCVDIGRCKNLFYAGYSTSFKSAFVLEMHMT